MKLGRIMPLFVVGAVGGTIDVRPCLLTSSSEKEVWQPQLRKTKMFTWILQTTESLFPPGKAWALDDKTPYLPT